MVACEIDDGHVELEVRVELVLRRDHELRAVPRVRDGDLRRVERVHATRGESGSQARERRFRFRRALWRPDRWPSAPATRLPLLPLARDDGWCDDPADPDYNRPIRLPHPARHERMWRDDALYDLVLVIGHNDDPPVPGLGSAIFVHVARPDFGPTEGCVALARADLAALAARLAPDDALTIRP